MYVVTYSQLNIRFRESVEREQDCSQVKLNKGIGCYVVQYSAYCMVKSPLARRITDRGSTSHCIVPLFGYSR